MFSPHVLHVLKSVKGSVSSFHFFSLVQFHAVSTCLGSKGRVGYGKVSRILPYFGLFLL